MSDDLRELRCEYWEDLDERERCGAIERVIADNIAPGHPCDGWLLSELTHIVAEHVGANFEVLLDNGHGFLAGHIIRAEMAHVVDEIQPQMQGQYR